MSDPANVGWWGIPLHYRLGSSPTPPVQTPILGITSPKGKVIDVLGLLMVPVRTWQ